MNNNPLVPLRSVLEANKHLTPEDLIEAQDKHGVPLLARFEEPVSARGFSNLILSYCGIDPVANAWDLRRGFDKISVHKALADNKEHLKNRRAYGNLAFETDKSLVVYDNSKLMNPPRMKQLGEPTTTLEEFNEKVLRHVKELLQTEEEKSIASDNQELCKLVTEVVYSARDYFYRTYHSEATLGAANDLISLVSRSTRVLLQKDLFFVPSSQAIRLLLAEQKFNADFTTALFKLKGSDVVRYDPRESDPEHVELMRAREEESAQAFIFPVVTNAKNSQIKPETGFAPERSLEAVVLKPSAYVFCQNEQELIEELKAHVNKLYKDAPNNNEISLEYEARKICYGIKEFRITPEISIDQVYMRKVDLKLLDWKYQDFEPYAFIKEHHSQRLRHAILVFFDVFVSNRSKITQITRKQLVVKLKTISCTEGGVQVEGMALTGGSAAIVARMFLKVARKGSGIFYIDPDKVTQLPQDFLDLLELADQMYKGRLEELGQFAEQKNQEIQRIRELLKLEVPRTERDIAEDYLALIRPVPFKQGRNH